MTGTESQMIKSYKSVSVTRLGSPEVLQVGETELREPGKKEARIKVLAAAVCRPDITVRNGTSLYSSTPLGQKIPFVPGYAVVGEVDATGPDVTQVEVGDRVSVLTVIGGYTEFLYWRSDRLIPTPTTVDPAEAVTLILNYLVAYQAMHRSAGVRAGEAALIIGASGGIGTALLQLGKLAGLRMYGIASEEKHDIVTRFGATPIDYRSQDYLEVIREAESDGIDAVFDGMMRLNYIEGGLSLLRRGGTLVSFGEPANLRALFRILGTFLRQKLTPNGISFKLYGTSSYFLFGQDSFNQDWATLFKLLEERQIEPVIMERFPILEAAAANQLLESGMATGNVVLVSPELIDQ
jgi:NADPH:quinone reductase-like Zn-dependent oxidoreductase